MTVLQQQSLDEFQAPAGPIRTGALFVLGGRVTLVAGAATDALGLALLPAAAQVYASRRVAGGTPGHISCANDGLGNVQFTNTSATDTSSCDYFVFLTA